MWPFKKRDGAPDEEREALEELVRGLRREVKELAADVEALEDRVARREGRENARAHRERKAPAANGALPSIASLRLSGRSPFGG